MKILKKISVFFILLCSHASPQNGELASINNYIFPKNNTVVKSAYEMKVPLSMATLNHDHDNFDPLKRELNYPVLAGVGAAALGIGIGVHIYQRNAWWSDQRTAFHIQYDWDYSLWIDKIGHFYAAAGLAHLFSAGLEAGNMQSEQAAIYGSIASFAFELYVEIEDGYGPDWGFSPGDVAANLLGSGFTLAQYYYPFLKNFQPKLSYLPSDKVKKGLHRGNGIDDYEGQKYWLSMRVKNLLPENISNYWPAFLNIAAGISVKELDGSGGGYREYFVALDLDAEELPLYGPVWQFIKNTLNYIHFPMPGVRITPNAAFFVFCF
jgi:hypothetical protein